MAGINEGMQYLKSLPSFLKILEIILLLVSIGPVGYFLNNAPDFDFDKRDNLKFFVGAAAASAVIALLFFLIFLTGAHKKIDAFNWARTAAGIFLVLAILLLVASSLLADTVSQYHSDGTCKWMDVQKTKYQCGQLTAGTVFGFFSIVIFIVDAIIHFRL
ncbi:uncharacterized protein LOC114541231 [Dendronephthya gigantea]|uniref:uncharacterized protein LOC114521352 n=1 Tax=Dendronephthya gigantea TaxID=151771 RepID=UPI00106BD3F5|nr:uncharacterized protein LOC114521352 [Dendronephthya gigantea]XP_028397568.1 uncharacterized protein LOC114521352 [Dendronephthya gigantea]XP_028417014.1 uncharacterized protein LOC114541231 [Dendronephthya gigantea]XP_028417015.1 uncharacterized protein LOC114541231 [Dendronephthya gigantea]